MADVQTITVRGRTEATAVMGTLLKGAGGWAQSSARRWGCAVDGTREVGISSRPKAVGEVVIPLGRGWVRGSDGVLVQV